MNRPEGGVALPAIIALIAVIVCMVLVGGLLITAIGPSALSVNNVSASSPLYMQGVAPEQTGALLLGCFSLIVIAGGLTGYIFLSRFERFRELMRLLSRSGGIAFNGLLNIVIGAIALLLVYALYQAFLMTARASGSVDPVLIIEFVVACAVCFLVGYVLRKAKGRAQLFYGMYKKEIGPEPVEPAQPPAGA